MDRLTDVFLFVLFNLLAVELFVAIAVLPPAGEQLTDGVLLTLVVLLELASLLFDELLVTLVFDLNLFSDGPIELPDSVLLFEPLVSFASALLLWYEEEDFRKLSYLAGSCFMEIFRLAAFSFLSDADFLLFFKSWSGVFALLVDLDFVGLKGSLDFCRLNKWFPF